MRWTLRRGLSRSRAFTLIELTVVVLVLALMSAMVVPRLNAVKSGIDAKVNMDAIQRLASRARESAMSTGRPVAMAYNETDRAFELRQNNADGDSEVSNTLAIHPDFEPNRFVNGTDELTASDWTLSFYPDGTSDGGGFEMDEGGITRSLVVGARNGLSKWSNGSLPVYETEKWQAGEYERRG